MRLALLLVAAKAGRVHWRTAVALEKEAGHVHFAVGVTAQPVEEERHERGDAGQIRLGAANAPRDDAD